jgi:hypothetical protein
MSNINVGDLPAFPPPGFTKEKAEELLKVIEEAKEKAKNEQH